MSELPVALPPELPKPQTLVCANCGADLAGEYCASCGQRHEPHVHTVGHFASEAFESISHADSRLWRTLWLLFARPGFLTREFFEGRRARYLPPFRLYLVLSVILVLLSSMAGEDDLSSAPAGTGTAKTVLPAADAGSTPAPAAPVAGSDEVADADKAWQVDIDALNQFCDPFFQLPDTEGGNRAGRDNIRRFCQRARNDLGGLLESVVQSIPRAMFVFLPLIALVMKLLYWRPPRYYVEHLLFLVHNHSALFLVYTLVALVSFVPVIGDFSPLFFFAALAYLAWYVYRAMRTVYAQSRWLTLLKYFVMFWTYISTALAGFLLTLVVIAIWG